MLKHIYPIAAVIETGTFEGSTTAFFARTFEEVHTIDVSALFTDRSTKTDVFI